MAIPIHDRNAVVTAEELSHLLTRSPKGSGYKSVYKAKDNAWRVRVRDRKKVVSIEKYYKTPREAACAVVRYYRQRYGAHWQSIVRPGYDPPIPAPRPARLKTKRFKLRWVAGSAHLVACTAADPNVVIEVIEQARNEWVLLVRLLGTIVPIESPNRCGYFQSHHAALIYLGMVLRDSVMGLKALRPGRARMSRRRKVKTARRESVACTPSFLGSPEWSESELSPGG